jgi:predicted membrane protein
MIRRSGIFWGLILILFGATFLLGNLGYVDFTLGRLVADFWPVVLIYIGARMVSTTYGKKAGSTVVPSLSGDAVTLAPGQYSLSARYLLGDLVVKPESRIEGGALQIGLGNLEVDLRMSGPRTGSHTLECITRVGHLRVLLPTNCEYRVEVLCMAGDVVLRDASKDGIAKKLEAETPGYEAASDRLLIRARAGVGSVFVR